mmetsp:Transcript_4544/g.11426  ORF Transcript_4544/g.11426 Transcript_4544/m.11426 type:complete len:267 (-) Transcript_4544:535-1335(-)
MKSSITMLSPVTRSCFCLMGSLSASTKSTSICTTPGAASTVLHSTALVNSMLGAPTVSPLATKPGAVRDCKAFEIVGLSFNCRCTSSATTGDAKSTMTSTSTALNCSVAEYDFTSTLSRPMLVWLARAFATVRSSCPRRCAGDCAENVGFSVAFWILMANEQRRTCTAWEPTLRTGLGGSVSLPTHRPQDFGHRSATPGTEQPFPPTRFSHSSSGSWHFGAQTSCSVSIMHLPLVHAQPLPRHDDDSVILVQGEVVNALSPSLQVW